MNPINQNLQFSSAMPENVTLSNVENSHDSIDADLERRLNSIGTAKPNQPANSDMTSDGSETEGNSQIGSIVDTVSDLERFLNDESCTHLSRRSADQNEETVTHLIRVQFEPEQSRSVLHLPFYPPLGSTPEISARAINHIARIRITQCERFGARFEIVVDQSNQMPKTVVIEVFGSAKLACRE